MDSCAVADLGISFACCSPVISELEAGGWWPDKGKRLLLEMPSIRGRTGASLLFLANCDGASGKEEILELVSTRGSVMMSLAG